MSALVSKMVTRMSAYSAMIGPGCARYVETNVANHPKGYRVRLSTRRGTGF